MADVRETEAEEDYEDAAGKTEADRQRQPFRRRFGVKFSNISDHLPSITSHLHRFSRGSKDPRRTSIDDDVRDNTETNREGDSSKQRVQPAGQLNPPLQVNEGSQLERLSSRERLVLAPAKVQLSSTPILSIRTSPTGAQSVRTQSSAE